MPSRESFNGDSLSACLLRVLRDGGVLLRPRLRVTVAVLNVIIRTVQLDDQLRDLAALASDHRAGRLGVEFATLDRDPNVLDVITPKERGQRLGGDGRRRETLGT